MKLIKGSLLFLLVFVISALAFDWGIKFLHQIQIISDYSAEPVFDFYPQDNLNSDFIKKKFLEIKDRHKESFFYKDVLKIGPSVLYNSSVATSAQMATSNSLQSSPYFLFLPNSGLQAQRTLKNPGDVFDVRINFDSAGRRKQPWFNPSKKPLLVIGCSYVFGAGLNDNETLPYYLARLKSDYSVFNLGIYSGSINDHLDEVSKNENSLYADLKENPEGLAIYVGMFDHLQRATCSLKCFNSTYKSWLPLKSNYNYEYNSLARAGSFLESRPFENSIYRLLNQFYFTEYFQMDFSIHGSEKQIAHYILQLRQFKQILQKKYKLRFVFVNYPNTYKNWPAIKASLEKEKIDYLDFSGVDFESLTERRHKIPYDGHPTSLSNELFAELLNNELLKISN